MRITGGILSGRRYQAPPGSVRPTQDRVRESLFAQLGERLVGARVLDLFAGSGALGLEAWSRGAARVCWIERDPKVFRVLRANVTALCRDPERPVQMLCKNVFSALKTLESKEPFDIILADPPYAMHSDSSEFGKLFQLTGERALLSPGGFFVLEHADREGLSERAGWHLVRARKYGETKISIWEVRHDPDRHISRYI